MHCAATECPNMEFPNLTSYVSPKEEDSFFRDLAKNLLAYVELWPTARGAKRMVSPNARPQCASPKRVPKRVPQARPQSASKKRVPYRGLRKAHCEPSVEEARPLILGRCRPFAFASFSFLE